MSINEPIEHAQKTTGKVTAKQLLTALRAGDGKAGLHGRAAHERASYSDSFVFLARTSRKDRKSGAEQVTEIEVPGWVSNGTTSETEEHTAAPDSGLSRRRWFTYSNAFRPMKGFWWLFAAEERLRDALECLPGDAQVSFHVALDHGTSELHIGATVTTDFATYKGLHTDHLYLVAECKGRNGKSKTRTFLIDASTGVHNTARFGSPRDERDAQGYAK